jgi:hypothetical protein
MSQTRSGPPSLAAVVIDSLGGRYSAKLGIDLDGGDDEIERWALAATLFGARIAAGIAERTFATLERAGVHSLAAAGRCEPDYLIRLLDAGGYARYDFRTASRLHAIAEVLNAQHRGLVSSLLDLPAAELEAALDALPGWGAVTVALFLRELRGVRPGLDPPIVPRAVQGAEHLGLLAASDADALVHLRAAAREAGVDVRDLEAALVRLSLAHRRRMSLCAGGDQCELLVSSGSR